MAVASDVSLARRPSNTSGNSSDVASESTHRNSLRNSSQAFPALRKVEVLEALDNARIQWYHFATVLVAGCGFFTDAYDLFSISIVTKLLGRIYYPQPSSPGELPFNVRLAVTAVALCGTFAGALFFGCMGDRFGRRKVYGVTLILMIMCSIGSGLSFGNTAKSVMTTLCFFRFWLGFGIGGDYPLSATIMSEYANVKSRGMFIGAVFAVQGFGILFAAMVGLTVSAIFNHYTPSQGRSSSIPPPEADFMWRVILMIGALPALLTLYFRLRIAETPRYTALVNGDIAKATEDIARLLEEDELSAVERRAAAPAMEGRWKAQKRAFFSREFKRQFGKQLFGTCTAWFLLDITFYSQNLFQDDVLADVGWLPAAQSMTAGEEVFQVSRSQALIALCATVPGYWVAVATIEKLGRRTIQLQGFLFMSIFTLIIGLSFYDLRGQKQANSNEYTGGHQVLFLILYAVIFFFSNFGPNTTTFIVPAELFPVTLRSTCFGMSAAAGKVGAVVGSFGFLYAKQSSKSPDKGYPHGIGPRGAFLMLAFLNMVGFFVTYLCTPETQGRSLEELSGDFEPLNDPLSE